MRFLHNPRRSSEILSRISLAAVEYSTFEAHNEPSRSVYHWLPACLIKLGSFLKFQVALCRSRQVGKLTRPPMSYHNSTPCANLRLADFTIAATIATILDRPVASEELSGRRGMLWSKR